MSKILIAAAMTALLAGNAVAADTITTTRIAVSYADLNIHNKAGIAVLMGRLRQAARAACGGEPTIANISEALRYQSCQQTALDNAVTSIASPELAALYQDQPLPSQVASK